jgi:putative tryptophan/tyrosine transport system substrate-binding protein
MRRREFIALVSGAAAMPLAARAQQADKVHRIGLLRVGSPPPSFIEPLKRGLRELGHVEGKSIVIEYGLAKSAAELPEQAAYLIGRKIDVLVASGTPSVMPANNAPGNVPVVFIAALDPVTAGIAASLARPGGKVTGVSAVHADVTGKRLQLLKELMPQLATIAILVRATSPATPQYVQEAESAARALGLALQVASVAEPRELEKALASAQSAGALVTVDDAVFTAQRGNIAELALKNRVATISGLRETVEAGGLLSYGPHYGDLYLRAARHVSEILKGAKPGDLPIEQPTKFELVINLKTAKALGITVPPSLLARADEVIE